MDSSVRREGCLTRILAGFLHKASKAVGVECVKLCRPTTNEIGEKLLFLRKVRWEVEEKKNPNLQNCYKMSHKSHDAQSNSETVKVNLNTVIKPAGGHRENVYCLLGSTKDFTSKTFTAAAFLKRRKRDIP